MNIWLLIVLFGSAGTLWLAWRCAVTRRMQTPAGRHHAEDYHCVSLRFGKDACAAVRDLRGTRFMPDEAPEIPHAVALTAAEFEERASEFDHPVLLAQGVEYATIQTLRSGLKGNYLVARIPVGLK